MAAQKALRGVAAAVGLGILSLTASFNQAAFADPAPGTPQVAANQNQAAPVQNISAALFDTVKELADYYVSDKNPSIGNPYYDSRKNPEFARLTGQIMTYLGQGADPNYIDPQTGISAFAWAMWMAYELDKPEIVQEFLDRGADPRQTVPSSMPLPGGEQNAVDTLYGKLYKPDSAKPIAMIDHVMRAVIESQGLNNIRSGSLTHSRTAAKIAAMFQAKGVTPADAQQLPDKLEFEIKENGQKVIKSVDFKYKTYLDIARDDILTAKALEENSLISADDYALIADGEADISKAAKSLTSLTDAFMKQHKAPLVDYPDAFPGGPEPYTVKAGETPVILAGRFRDIMGAPDDAQALRLFKERNKDFITAQGDFIAGIEGKEILIPVDKSIQVEKIAPPSPGHALIGVAGRMQLFLGTFDVKKAMGQIAKANGINKDNMDQRVQIGAPIKIPTLIGGTITTKIEAADVLNPYAAALKKKFYDPAATVPAILDQVLHINGLDKNNITLKNCERDEMGNPVKKCESLLVPFANDGPTYGKALQPPATYDPSRKVYYFTVEGISSHQKNAFQSAINTNYAINNQVDFSQFHVIEGVVSNVHIGTPGKASTFLQILQNPDNSLRDNIVFSSSLVGGIAGGRGVPYDEAETTRLTNPADHVDYERTRLNLETLEKASPIVFQGAGNEYPEEQRFSGRYSTLHTGRTVLVGAYGTYSGVRMISHYSSYAADICGPLPKNQGKQLEGTSFSAPATGGGIYRQFSEWYGNILSFEEIMAAGMMSADRDILDMFARKLVVPRPELARYRTNGAGLPFHERCGAGAINIERWNETLQTMVDLKQKNNPGAAYRSIKIDFDDAPVVKDLGNGQKEYIYRIPVPENMTLGKLTFLLPQEPLEHSEIVVKTPSGFAWHLHKSFTDIVSTSAFSYEDVKAGDVIEIHTGAPLAKTAGMYLRGYEDGNSIQLLRDHLRKQGILPSPLKTMVGNTVDGNDPGVTVDLGPHIPDPKKPDEPEGAAREKEPEVPPYLPKPDGPAPL